MMPWNSCVLWLEKARQGRQWVDTSKYGNNGAIIGAAWRGDSLEFDGIDDYVDCGNHTSLNITEAITIEAWIKTPSLIVYTAIMWGETSAGKRRALLLWNGGSGNGRLYFSGYGAAANIDSGIRIDDNIWHHCVVTKNSSEFVKTYVDGVAGGSGSVTLASYNYTGTHIGQGVDGTEPFNGAISLVRIYNIALTAEQVLETYEQSYKVV